jgi:hypothetical protein
MNICFIFLLVDELTEEKRGENLKEGSIFYYFYACMRYLNKTTLVTEINNSMAQGRYLT